MSVIEKLNEMQLRLNEQKKQVTHLLYALFADLSAQVEQAYPSCEECGKRAQVEREGHCYCGYHDPDGSHKSGMRKKGAGLYL